MKKCPPGVICVENFSLFFIIISVFLIGYLIYVFSKKNEVDKIIIHDRGFVRNPITNFPNLNIDPLLNPYTPPLKDQRYDTNYRQLGILTPVNGTSKDNILPLMGRPLLTSRYKWQYYSTSNQHNNIKLPIRHNGKNGMNEYGCDELFSKDIVYVEGIDEKYKVTMYENNTIHYSAL